MSDKEMRIKIKVDNTEVNSAFKKMGAAQNALSKQMGSSSKGMAQSMGAAGNAAQGLTGKLGGLGKAWVSANVGFGTFTAGLSPLTAGLSLLGTGVKAAAGFAKEAIGDYATFEGTLKQVQIVAGGTQADMDMLGDKAIEIGSKTSKGAQEVANAMVDFAKLGFTAKETASAMDGIVMAAEASGSSVETTSQIVATALNVWSLSAEDATHVADVLAKTSNETAADMTDLGYVLQYAGSSASLAGASMEELAAMAGIMADNGIRGSKAGTSLRTAFTNLISPTDAAATAMDNLGVAYKDAEGKARPTMDVIRDLQGAVKGMSDIEIQDLATTIFGKTGAAGMSFVLKKTSGELDELTNALVNSTGTAAKQAEAMRQTMAGQLDQLGDSWDAIKLKIGKGLTEGAALDGVKLLNKELDSVSLGLDDFSKGFSYADGLLKKSGGMISGYQDAKKFGDMVIQVGSDLNSMPVGESSDKLWDWGNAMGVNSEIAMAFGEAMSNFNFLPENWESEWSSMSTALQEGTTGIELNLAKATASVAAGGRGDIAGTMARTIQENLPAIQAAMTAQTGVFDQSNESRLQALQTFFASSKTITGENQAAALASEVTHGEQQRSSIQSNNEQILALYQSLGSQNVEQRAATNSQIQSLQAANDEILKSNAQVTSDSILATLQAQSSATGTITQQQADTAIVNANKQYAETVAAAQNTYTQSVSAINSMSAESIAKTGYTKDQLIANAQSQMTSTVQSADTMQQGVVNNVQKMADKSEEVDGTHIQINADADTSSAMESLGQLAATINNVIASFNNTVGKIKGEYNSLVSDGGLAGRAYEAATKKRAPWAKARGGLTSGVGYGVGGGAQYSPNATAHGTGNQLGQAGLGGGVISNEKGREVTMPIQNATYMRPFAAAVARELQSVGGMGSGDSAVVNVPLYINGKEFARATNKDMQTVNNFSKKLTSRANG